MTFKPKLALVLVCGLLTCGAGGEDYGCNAPQEECDEDCSSQAGHRSDPGLGGVVGALESLGGAAGHPETVTDDCDGDASCAQSHESPDPRAR